MAHTKSGGAAKRTVNVAGKRLGFKKFAGEHVIPGNIILRQRGTRFHPGVNVKLGKDHTVFAVAEGYVSFRQMSGYKRAKKYVDVLPERKGAAPKKATAKPKTAEPVEANKEEKPVAKVKSTKKATTAKKAPAKKAAAKK